MPTVYNSAPATTVTMIPGLVHILESQMIKQDWTAAELHVFDASGKTHIVTIKPDGSFSIKAA